MTLWFHQNMSVTSLLSRASRLPNKEDYFGYNNDYTGFVPIDGRTSNDGYLWVNHEYVSYPISLLAPEVSKDLAGFPESYSGWVHSHCQRSHTLLVLYNMGGSIIRISRPDRSGRFAVASDPKIGAFTLCQG